VKPHQASAWLSKIKGGGEVAIRARMTRPFAGTFSMTTDSRNQEKQFA
jgi:hypothetical protein